MAVRTLFGLGLIFLLACAASCSDAVTRRTAAGVSAELEEDKKTVQIEQDDQVALRGWAKIQENDCPSCHSLERKSVGPSYTAIVAKYEATDVVVKMLAERIIMGSVGAWGEIPMPAHPGLSKEDAEQMVKFVFTIKNKYS